MSTLRRLFSTQPLTEAGGLVRLDARESHHGRDVLRLRAGARVAVFDEAGRQFEATFERLEKKRLVLVLGEPLPAAPETPIPVFLCVALAKGPAFDSVLQRAVEMGVAEIVPFVAQRSVPAPKRGGALERKIERWRQILLSATKQCGRARLTAIAAPAGFLEIVKRNFPEAGRFCCAADPAAQRFGQVLRDLDVPNVKSVAVMIGPEGGLSSDEIDQARAEGWQMVSLGPRILRVETATAAALALVLAHLGEM